MNSRMAKWDFAALQWLPNICKVSIKNMIDNSVSLQPGDIISIDGALFEYVEADMMFAGKYSTQLDFAWLYVKDAEEIRFVRTQTIGAKI